MTRHLAAIKHFFLRPTTIRVTPLFSFVFHSKSRVVIEIGVKTFKVIGKAFVSSTEKGNNLKVTFFVSLHCYSIWFYRWVKIFSGTKRFWNINFWPKKVPINVKKVLPFIIFMCFIISFFFLMKAETESINEVFLFEGIEFAEKKKSVFVVFDLTKGRRLTNIVPICFSLWIGGDFWRKKKIVRKQK